jgi:hypothetical protein
MNKQTGAQSTITKVTGQITGLTEDFKQFLMQQIETRNKYGTKDSPVDPNVLSLLKLYNLNS